MAEVDIDSLWRVTATMELEVEVRASSPEDAIKRVSSCHLALAGNEAIEGAMASWPLEMKAEPAVREGHDAG